MDHVLYVLWLTWITWRTSVIGSSTSSRNFMNFQVVSFCFWFYMRSLPFRASFTHKVLTRFLQYSTISTLKLWHLPKKSTALMDFYIGPSQAQLTIMSHVAGISQRFASVALDCSCSCLAVLPICFEFFFLWYQASFPSRLDVWKCSWKKIRGVTLDSNDMGPFDQQKCTNQKQVSNQYQFRSSLRRHNPIKSCISIYLRMHPGGKHLD